jgi:hypothetical protein
MSVHARELHRQLDRAQAEAHARDSDDDGQLEIVRPGPYGQPAPRKEIGPW